VVFSTTWGLVDWNGSPVPPGRYVVRGRLLLFAEMAARSFVDADNSPLNIIIRPKE
jgi:hypothetical protein